MKASDAKGDAGVVNGDCDCGKAEVSERVEGSDQDVVYGLSISPL